MIFDKLVVIHESGAIEYPVYKDGYCPYSLKFDYPDPRLIRDAIEVYKRFDSSKEIAGDTMRLVLREGTKKAARPQGPYSWQQQQKSKARNKRRNKRDGDVIMG